MKKPGSQEGSDLASDRLRRLRTTMTRLGTDWLLTADPINITYASGVRNMNVFSMMGPSRLLLVGLDDTVIAWEFAGSEHLAEASRLVDDVRTTPGITALSGGGYRDAITALADEIASIVGTTEATRSRLAVERLDHEMTDALRSAGCTLSSATEVFVESRRIKLPGELELMSEAMKRVEAGVTAMLASLRAGATEIEVWSHFQQQLIASHGEFVSTRLVQSGTRTFPYFREAGPHVVADGDLFCIDTDAIGLGGYAVDFSRTYHVGPSAPTAQQRHLHALAREQLEHNAALIAPGVQFEQFARQAWTVPDRYAPYGYSSLAHGLGMCGEFPYIPVASAQTACRLDGRFEPNMVVCVESYIGDPDSRQGVKLEDQYLVTATGAERMSTLPFDPRLS